MELEQNVQGTVTLSWVPSPDEKRDDRLHYVVMKRDNIKRTWRIVGDRLFNHKFTAANILPGREYNFRVFAKNDMGLSEPAVAPPWGTVVKKGWYTDTVHLLLLSFKEALRNPSFLFCIVVALFTENAT